MKNLTTLFMILITTPVFAVKIDANTPIEWNSLVIEEALKRVGLGWGSLSNYDLVEPRSVSYLVSICVYWSKYALTNRFTDFGEDGNYLPGKEEEIKEKAKNLCKKFGAELININNEIASIADYAHNATTKSSCENNRKAIWVDSKNICVPKNPCMFTQYKNYCLLSARTAFPINYYRMPDGNKKLKSADVVNMYVRHLGFNCSVEEREIFKEYGYTVVPCKGSDYVVLEFSSDDTDNNVTGLLCKMYHAYIGHDYSGWPTRCQTEEKEVCESIKALVGKKIKVEYKRTIGSDEFVCQIGEFSDKYYSGEIHW